MHSRAGGGGGGGIMMIRPKYKPTINGKVVDLELLYQIVTSHGGWEKVNNRNEWDDLLEHFHLPRGTNGGLVIKQIYLKYLENYEKIYFLGEDGGHKDDMEDDYDDVRNRRRTASKMTSRSSYSHSLTPSAASVSNSLLGTGNTSTVSAIPLSDSARESMGLPKRGGTDYDKLLLSLQAPLPNEQDMALSICTLLSNETKHVIKLPKCPSVLTYLLAHAGVYRDCGLRKLTEETYSQGREMNLTEFWEELVLDPDIKSLLCESYVQRLQSSLINLEEDAIVVDVTMNIDSLTSREEESPSTVEEEEEPSPKTNDSPPDGLDLGLEEELVEGEDGLLKPKVEDIEKKEIDKPLDKPEVVVKPKVVKVDLDLDEDLGQGTCCSSCPCNKPSSSSSSKSSSTLSSKDYKEQGKEKDEWRLPPTLSRSHGSDDKVSKRLHQIALIIRNLSFEEENASIMAQNTTLLRYLLLTAHCKFGTLVQNSFDTLGNIASHIELKDPSLDPLSSLLLSLLFSGLFSEDRFVILGSLEAIRNLTRSGERNEKILTTYIGRKVASRLCELLTLCDIMLLIYTLEAILSLTGIGEAVCNELVRVKGSVASFVALVTVEAQSYGPKGCILMRVVETVSGSQGNSNSTATPVSSSVPQQASPSSLPKVGGSPATAAGNSIQAIGLRTVSGQTVVPPPPSSSSSTTTATFANSPSPLSGTVSAVNVSHVHNFTPQPRPTPTSQGIGQRLTSVQVHPPKADSPGPGGFAQTRISDPLSSHSHPQQQAQVNHVNQNHIKVGVIQQPTQTFTQTHFSPSLPSENVTEESWATAWLKGGFEQLSGTSIEEGELYRSYCGARKKHPASLLSQAQLVQCVKLVYGASVGPVTKNFGATSLSFIEGLRPRMSLQQNNVNVPSIPSSLSLSLATTNAEVIHSATNGCGESGRPPTPVSSTQCQPSSPLSPILKATLSRPPTPKSPTPLQKLKKSLSATKEGGKKSVGKEKKKGPSEGKVMSPSSSAIRSLLASKVAQRQQNKLAQESTPNAISKKGGGPTTKKGTKGKGGKSQNFIKMNGEASPVTNEASEGSASSSNLSIGGGGDVEPSVKMEEGSPPPALSFQGLLCNGISDGSKEGHEMEVELAEESSGVKGMLVDLLERKVVVSSHNHPTSIGLGGSPNGLVGREIRISDKGLELIDNQTSEVVQVAGEVEGQEGQEPQKMTFYASPEVSIASSENNCVRPASSASTSAPQTVLLSGGGHVTGVGEVVVVSSESVEILDFVNNDGDGGSTNNETNGGSGNNDLLEKFSEFSDLIMVTPEQLGLGKRPAPAPSTASSNEPTEEGGPPPVKKALVNGATDEPLAITGSVLHSALAEGKVTVQPSSVNLNVNQMMNLPIRLVSNSGTPIGSIGSLGNLTQGQQISFGGRSMMAQMLQPGQIVLSTGSGTAGQVLLSSKGGGTDSSTLTKAFILIPQSGQGGHMTLTNSPNAVQLVLKQLPAGAAKEGLSPNSIAHIPADLLEAELPYLCEWGGCGFRFQSYSQVFMHSVQAHVPSPFSTEAVRCEWGTNGCDPLLRKRFSIMTHLQDRHCNKQALDLSCYRRKNKIEPPPAPQQPVHHPGYAPNAAFHAIKRHALQYMNPKDVIEENEGPVTKSIRLTSALILRNLANFSPLGKRMIAAYESQLSNIAMSNAESSRTISQLLFDMSESSD